MGGIAAVTAATGCSVANNRASIEGRADSGDAGMVWLPDQPNARLATSIRLPAYARTPQVAEAYRFAVERPDLLRYVPCYCGCGSEGHMDNLACFVKGVGDDGSVAFDRHGSACGICVLIALDSKRLAAQGVPLTQIRQHVDRTFGSSGLSTNTPLPPST